MRGHDTIIQLRKAGQSPSWVFVNDFPCSTDWATYGEHATVCTAGDDLGVIEFQFLVGLSVTINSTSEDRAQKLMQIAKKASAKLVASSGQGWTDVWRKEQQNG